MNVQSLEQFARQLQVQNANSSDHVEQLESNICPTCHIIMDIYNDDYICQQCKCIITSDRHFSVESTKYGSIDGRYYYNSSDPQKEQRNNVFDCLVACRETYLKKLSIKHGISYIPDSSLIDNVSELSSLVPSTATLIKCASIYHDIQRKVHENGETFTKRGDVKNEILAAILFFECIKNEEMRNKREIAELMGLPSDGFSRGFEQLRRQASKNNITFYREDKLCAHMIVYYFRTILGTYLDMQISMIINSNYPQNYIQSAIQTINLARDLFVRFIRRIIKCSNKYHIGINSQPQSRIVGTIWLIVNIEKYSITSQQIDVASGGIKKGTFLKFSRVILTNPRLIIIAKRFFPQIAIPNFIML